MFNYETHQLILQKYGRNIEQRCYCKSTSFCQQWDGATAPENFEIVLSYLTIIAENSITKGRDDLTLEITISETERFL